MLRDNVDQLLLVSLRIFDQNDTKDWVRQLIVAQYDEFYFFDDVHFRQIFLSTWSLFFFKTTDTKDDFLCDDYSPRSSPEFHGNISFSNRSPWNRFGRSLCNLNNFASDDVTIFWNRWRVLGSWFPRLRSISHPVVEYVYDRLIRNEYTNSLKSVYHRYILFEIIIYWYSSYGRSVNDEIVA